jgi:hypothetical protein
MSIDINKSGSGSGSAGGGLDFEDPESSAEVKEIYRYAYDCKLKNMPAYQIEQALLNKGLDTTQVMVVMRNVNRLYDQRQSQNNAPADNGGGGGGGGVPRILIYIGILVLINILSAVFGWGFWIY